MKQHSRRYLFLCSAALFSLGLVTTAQAGIKEYNLATNKLALQGYDPVTYFTLGKAVLAVLPSKLSMRA